MKLPRWLVILMLTTSVLVPLAAAGWWWVTWPEVTLRLFLAQCAAEEFDDAKRTTTSELADYLTSDSVLRQSLSYREEDANWPIPTLVYNPKREWCSRTFSDLIGGRQRFTAPGAERKGRLFTVYKYELSARFGKISCRRAESIIIGG